MVMISTLSLSPGAMLTRFRALLSHVLLLVICVSMLQSCGWVAESMRPYLKEHRRLETEGEDARAEILSVSQTGWSINRQPEIKLELKIFPANSEPYSGKTTLICPLIMIPHYQPGKTVAVKIDRAKQTVTVKGSYQQTPGI